MVVSAFSVLGVAVAGTVGSYKEQSLVHSEPKE